MGRRNWNSECSTKFPHQVITLIFSSIDKDKQHFHFSGFVDDIFMKVILYEI